MPVHHDGHGWLRVLTLHVGHTALLTYAWRQGALGHITPVGSTPVVITLVFITVVIMTPVLMTPVLTAPVLLHPHGQRAAQGCIPVLVLLLVWPPPPLHFL